MRLRRWMCVKTTAKWYHDSKLYFLEVYGLWIGAALYTRCLQGLQVVRGLEGGGMESARRE